MTNVHLSDLALLAHVGVINFLISFVILCVLCIAMFYTLILQPKEPDISVAAMFILSTSLLGLLFANHVVAISIVYSSDVLAVSDSLGLNGLVAQIQDLYRFIDSFLTINICFG